MFRVCRVYWVYWVDCVQRVYRIYRVVEGLEPVALAQGLKGLTVFLGLGVKVYRGWGFGQLAVEYPKASTSSSGLNKSQHMLPEIQL